MERVRYKWLELKGKAQAQWLRGAGKKFWIVLKREKSAPPRKFTRDTVVEFHGSIDVVGQAGISISSEQPKISNLRLSWPLF